MDGLTFVDHLIGHLAWPLAVTGLIGFLSFRHRAAINSLINRIHKAKAGLFEIELAELKASTERAQLPPPPVLAPSGPPKDEADPPTGDDPWREEVGKESDRLMRLALENPRLAVNETYHFVNRYVFEASQELLDPEQIRYTDGSPAVRRAAVIHLLAPPYVDVLDRLRDAALSAVDPDEEIMPGQALDYVLHATQLVGFLAGRLQVRRAARAQEAADES